MSPGGCWAVAVPYGYRIGPWEVTRPVASGAWGSVYAARRHLGDDGEVGAAAEVALKVIPTGTATPRLVGQVAEMVRREIAGHDALRHPRLVQTLDVLTVDDAAHPELDGAAVLVMELARDSLADQLAACDERPLPDAGRCLAQIAEGLAAVHGMGWVHGDLKPRNVLRRPAGDYCLTDFGLAGLVDGTHAYVPPLATPDFAPPERRIAVATTEGHVVRPSGDIWAFGVLACLVLAGRMPFPGETAWARAEAAAEYVCGGRALSLPATLAPDWEALIRQCLAADPRQRPTAGQLLATLAESADGARTPGRPARAGPEPAPRRVAVRRATMGGVMAGGVVVGGVMALAGVAAIAGVPWLSIPARHAATAHAAAPDPAPARLTAHLDVTRLTGSIAYLQDRYQLTQAEALRRLALQRDAVSLEEWLAGRHADRYTGLWLDQAGGGILTIAANDPAFVIASTRNLGYGKYLRVIPARWSLDDLRGTRDRLDARINGTLRGAGRRAEVTVDPQQDTVAVFERDAGAQTPARPDQAIVAALAAEPGRATLHQLVTLTPKAKAVPAASSTAGGCAPASCRAPMRAGMRLDVRLAPSPTGPATAPSSRQRADSRQLNPSWRECTAGFNVRDNRGWNYIMTAGHCTVGDGTAGDPLRGDTRTFAADHVSGVGYELPDFEEGPAHGDSAYPYDYAIQPYQDGRIEHWLGSSPSNQVIAWCEPSAGPCTGQTDVVHGSLPLEEIGSGFVECLTGSGDADPVAGSRTNAGVTPGTRCGEVLPYHDGGIRTDICSRPGDSGGPLFSEVDGMALGILSDGTAAAGACPTDGSEVSDFSPLDKVFPDVNAQVRGKEGWDPQLHVSAG